MQKNIGFGNDLVVVFGHLRSGVEKCRCQLTGQQTHRLYQPSKL